MERVKKAVQDTTYYNNLAAKFADFEKLTPAELVDLYHGQMFQENYSPYDKLIWQPKVDKMLKEGKTSEALMYCTLLLFERPAFLPLINYIIHVAKKADFDKDIIDLMRKNKANMLLAIFASSTGKTPESSYYVASPSDEYLFLDRVLRIENKRIGVKEHNGRHYDVFEVKPNSFYEADKVYFDITNMYGKTFEYSDMIGINIELTPKNND